MYLLGSTLSALFGAVLGALLVIRHHRLRGSTDAPRVEPTYPPQLTLIEGGLRTGTDHRSEPLGRGW